MLKLQTLRSKVIASIVILYVLLLVSFFMVYEVAVSNIQHITIDLMNETVVKDAYQVDNILQSVEDMASLVANETDIQNALRQPIPDTMQEVYRQRLNFNYKIFNMQKFLDKADGVFVLGENGVIFRSSGKSLLQTAYTQEPWYKQVVEGGEAMWLDPNQPSVMVKNLQTKTLSYIYPIRDKTSFSVLGVVVVEMFSSELDNYFTDTFLNEGGVFIANENSTITYANNPDALQSYIDNFGKGNKENFYTEAKLGVEGWRLIAYLPERIVFSTMYQVRSTILIVFGVLSAAALILGWYFARRLTSPIENMQKNMKKVEQGDFEIVLQVQSDDELGKLTASFNHMIKKIKELIEHQRYQQEQMEKAELKALQSQINPHFLYNTLDSINWMARMNQLDSVSEMIEALTKIFRVSLSRGEILIPLKEEITHVTEYMKIQKYRYGDRVDFTLEIPEELQEYLIVKIILQPLVENALYHGLRDLDKKGSINICAHEDGDDIVIEISDTGMGISQTRLIELEKLLQSQADTSSKSYGIINVQRRLQVYFGVQYGIHYKSVQNKGTQVYVRIPKRKEV